MQEKEEVNLLMKPHYSQESSGHLCHESLFRGCQELSQQQHWKLLGQEKDFYFVRLTIQLNCFSFHPTANQPVILLCPLPLFLLSILFILPFSLPSRSLSILPSRIPSSLPSPFHLSSIPLIISFCIQASFFLSFFKLMSTLKGGIGS